MKIEFNLKLKIFILVFVTIVSILIALIVVNLKDDDLEINTYTNDVLAFNYDNVFKLVDDITLTTNDKKSIIVIDCFDYTTSMKSKDKYSISDSLSYQVVDDTNYEKVYESMSDNRYYYLYEDEEKEKQIEVIIIYSDNYIFTIIYEAKNDEFDLYATSLDIIDSTIGEIS